ncbi:PREDICTED: uncharacterized protein LOC108764352 isoform X3 [Trachymyrmex cornetzi]|uniref:Protein takeout n=1 Tax=Trachymyrmex cornetzi TaxID=471704 RepID=A0A151J2I1_9HYME|nr:PREDICTED: uncharacterized protein LOC108764352 isoform X3 [Trachymyrmex cornetzi]KYN16234.1 hypothetical protein ALC57_11520 [Trachymyrmex cornetzi]
MFAIIFTFALMTAYAAAEIPSYIHVCGRRDPNLDKCIVNSIDNLKDPICKGIPELNSPPLVPFFMKQITISDTDNAKLYVKDVEMTGLCDFVINSFHIDIDKLHFNMDLLFKHVGFNGTYDFDIKVLVPFVHKGPIYLTADDVGAKAEVDMKLVTKNDKKYVYLSKINLKLDFKNLNYVFDLNEKQSSQLSEIISNFFGSNEEEFISKVKPSIEAQISKQILILGNNIVKQFTFDELFPDQA